MAGILSHILVAVEQFLDGISSRWSEVIGVAVGYLGPAGKWIIWGLAAFLILFFVSKASKLAFDLLRFVILPSAAFSVALMLLVPGWAPMKTFPVFLAVSTAMMFLRGR